jgi:hypothetical protein
MVTAQLPGGSSVSFINEIREERKEFLRVAGFCGAVQAEERFLAVLYGLRPAKRHENCSTSSKPELTTLTPLISARLDCDPGFFEPALGMTAQDASVCMYGQ